jgi:hypothetical protein
LQSNAAPAFLNWSAGLVRNQKRRILALSHLRKHLKRHVLHVVGPATPSPDQEGCN